MRGLTNAAKVLRFVQELGERARGPGQVYLTGGASAVLYGWRDTTVDVDLKLDPEPEGAFEVLAILKNDLDMNVELAAPDQFIPPARGWRERSRFIARHGQVDFFHYDFVSQALSKIERGHGRDVTDVGEMMARNLVSVIALERYMGDTRGELVRYPAIDPAMFERKIVEFLAGCEKGEK